MHYRLLVIVSVTGMGLFAWLSGKLFAPAEADRRGSVYDFALKAIDGRSVSLGQFRGKYLLVVNTASKCGYTPQYADLQKLHELYGERVAVLGFPANNFLWQEPGTNDEIAGFCAKNYGVTFPLFEKISVRGKNQHPLYRWLAAHSGERPTWNFCKYLIDPNGKVTGFYGPKVSPLDDIIIKQLQP